MSETLKGWLLCRRPFKKLLTIIFIGLLVSPHFVWAYDPEVRISQSASSTFNLLEMRPLDEFNGGAQVVDLILQTSVCYRGDIALSARALNSLFRMSNGWNVNFLMQAKPVYVDESNSYILLKYEANSRNGPTGEMKIFSCDY